MDASALRELSSLADVLKIITSFKNQLSKPVKTVNVNRGFQLQRSLEAFKKKHQHENGGYNLGIARSGKTALIINEIILLINRPV